MENVNDFLKNCLFIFMAALFLVLCLMFGR